LTAIVEGSIDLATRLALPDKLDGAVTSAQSYTPDLGGADYIFAAQIFAGMTNPDPTPDPGPAPSATDLPLSADPSTRQSIHYLSPDGTYHTARAPQAGWWVETDAGGHSHLTLSIAYLNPDRQIINAARVGSRVIVGRDIDANPSGQRTVSSFQYLDWSPSDHTQYVARTATLASTGSVETWGIGATSVNTVGNNIEHFNATTGQWANVDGGAVVAAVGPSGQPWVVNKQGTIFRRSRGANGYVDGTWESVPGKATDIAIGGDGSVWATGVQAAGSAGTGILHYNPSAPGGWDQVDGNAIAVAVGPDGQPWVVNAQGTIFRRTRGNTGYVDGTWQVVPGLATAIAAGGDGSVWVLGTSTAGDGGYAIWHYNPTAANQATSGWEQVDGGAVSISVDANGAPWVVNKQGAAFRRNRGNTSYVDGAWSTLSPNGSATGVAVGGSLS
jgi:hypothetical protein